MPATFTREKDLEGAESAGRGTPDQKGAGLNTEINPGPELE